MSGELDNRKITCSRRVQIALRIGSCPSEIAQIKPVCRPLNCASGTRVSRPIFNSGPRGQLNS